MKFKKRRNFFFYKQSVSFCFILIFSHSQFLHILKLYEIPEIRQYLCPGCVFTALRLWNGMRCDAMEYLEVRGHEFIMHKSRKAISTALSIFNLLEDASVSHTLLTTLCSGLPCAMRPSTIIHASVVRENAK